MTFLNPYISLYGFFYYLCIMKIEQFSNTWYQILQVILNNKGSFIKVSQNRFNEFLSFLEGEERYEDCQFLFENKTEIIIK